MMFYLGATGWRVEDIDLCGLSISNYFPPTNKAICNIVTGAPAGSAGKGHTKCVEAERVAGGPPKGGYLPFLAGLYVALANNRSKKLYQGDPQLLDLGGHGGFFGNASLPGTQVPCTPLQAHAICPIIMHPYFPNSYGTLQYQVGVSDGRQGRVFGPGPALQSFTTVVLMHVLW